MNGFRNIVDELIAQLRRDRVKPYFLIVEDNEGDRLLMENEIRSAGFIFKSVRNGEEAKRALESHIDPEMPNFSIVLLDLMLPGMSGIDLLRIIREKDPGLHVIIVTGAIDPSLLERARGLGYFGCVMKPLDRKTVENIVEKHRLER